MATDEEIRSRWVPEIARVTRSQDFRTSFADVLKDRKQTIIVVLPEDLMGYVYERLRANDNAAVVAMPTDTALHLAVMWPASPERLAVAREDDALLPIHDESPVAMFFQCLRTLPGPIVVERLAARLVEHGTLVGMS